MRTDTGVVRAHNEDAAHVDPGGRFVVLADGMGGQGSGEVAAALSIEVITRELVAAEPELAAFEAAPTDEGRDRIRAELERVVRAAHDAVLAGGQKSATKGMGATLDLVVVAGGKAFVAHVGDGRTYVIRDGRAIQVTSDHTVAETLVRAGALTPEDAATSPLRTVLASAIGQAKMFVLDHAYVALELGDRLLICSDGLHNYLSAEDLASRLELAELDAGLAQLVDEAKARGGADNITAIVVEVYSPEAGPVAGVSSTALDALVDDSFREE
jgi:protein phosphatase